jgi:hypothetical protein
MAWFNWPERNKIKKNEENKIKIWKTKKKKKKSKDHWSPESQNSRIIHGISEG